MTWSPEKCRNVLSPRASQRAAADFTPQAFMNANRTTLAILVVALIGAGLYGLRRTRETQAMLATLSQDRDTLQRQVKTLTQLVADLNELQRTAAAEPQAPQLNAGTVPTPAPAPATPAPIKPVATPTVSITAPAGWWKNGSKANAYVVGVDRENMYAGMPSAYVQSLEPNVDGFGGMMQMSSAENFHGKRVRLSGWMKTQDANDGGGHLWLRVDGKQGAQPLQFDNMNGRAPKGTTDWQHYSVVLDVPPEASALAYGFFVEGAGKVWVSGTKIEEVGADVPTTNRIQNNRKLPTAPTNLTFGESG